MWPTQTLCVLSSSCREKSLLKTEKLRFSSDGYLLSPEHVTKVKVWKIIELFGYNKIWMLSVHSLEKANRGSVALEGSIFWLPEVHFKKFTIFLTIEFL